MKTNYSWVFLLLLSLGNFLPGCNSTSENKAKQVQQEQEEVDKALESGEDQEAIDEEKAEVDSARVDYEQAWTEERDVLRDKVNAQIEDIDERIATFQRDQQQVNLDKQKIYTQAIGSLKSYRARMSDQLLIIEKASAGDWQRIKNEVESLTEYTAHKVYTINVD